MYLNRILPTALLGLLAAPVLTGCASHQPQRLSIEPTWSYHDTPDPMAYSEVWSKPAGVGEVQVVHADEPR